MSSSSWSIHTRLFVQTESDGCVAKSFCWQTTEICASSRWRETFPSAIYRLFSPGRHRLLRPLISITKWKNSIHLDHTHRTVLFFLVSRLTSYFTFLIPKSLDLYGVFCCCCFPLFVFFFSSRANGSYRPSFVFFLLVSTNSISFCFFQFFFFLCLIFLHLIFLRKWRWWR